MTTSKSTPTASTALAESASPDARLIAEAIRDAGATIADAVADAMDRAIDDDSPSAAQALAAVAELVKRLSRDVEARSQQRRRRPARGRAS